MLQSQCMFRMWVMKKGSQQMMNTPGGEGGSQGCLGPGRAWVGRLRRVGQRGRTRIACFRPCPGTKAARAPQGEPRTWMLDLPLTPVCSHLTSLGLVFLPVQCI